ncbi:MAG: hypothetical protein A2293_16990 [Elusimicrobia bacterium RIFOXYB2_FULL_49_7]|nr:MAG: hypothetical protein A2293_16990 [Elusimicrobia bacterium RIFOXYB2_FULL_49_7]
MKNKVMIILFVVSLAFNFGVLGAIGFHWFMERQSDRCAPGGPGGPGGLGSWHKHRMEKRLGLTKEQSEAMDKNFKEFQASVEPLRTDIHKKRTELFALLQTTASYDSTVEDKVNAIALQQAEIEKKAIQNAIKTKAILTPEQQKKFNGFMGKGFKKMKKHGSRPMMPF